MFTVLNNAIKSTPWNSVAILRDAESENHFLNNLEHAQGVKIHIKG